MQSREHVASFQGPFLGLCTSRLPRELGPQFAVKAENVLLSDGTLRLCPPVVPYEDEPGDAVLGVAGMLQWDRLPEQLDEGSDADILLLLKSIHYDSAQLWVYRPASRTQLCSGLSLGRAATFVCQGGWVYVLDGTRGASPYEQCARPVKTNGTINGTFLLGIQAPTGEFLDTEPGGSPTEVDVWAFFVYEPGSYLDPGTYEWAVTFYNETCETESNPWYTGEQEVVGDYKARFFFRESPPADQGISHYRVYRKNVTAGHVGYRFVGEWKIGEGLPVFTDDLPDDYVTVSDLVTGWGSVANGLPPNAGVGCLWKGRMWMNDATDGRKLFYSAVDHPDYVDPADFLLLEGRANDQITGMVELAGHLIVLKEESIWVIAGDLSGLTNDIVATGAIPDVVYPEVYQTPSRVGCANLMGGNGAIVCGHPPVVYFNASTGLMRFDGTDTRCVSDLIGPTWRQFTAYNELVREEVQRISFAVDADHEVLYMTQFRPGTPHVLAYHYGRDRGDGVGVWSTLALPEVCSCVAPSIGRLGPAWTLPVPTAYAGLLIASGGLVYVMDNANRTDSDTPAFVYETGDLVISEGLRKHVYGMRLFHGRAAGNVNWGFRRCEDQQWTHGPLRMDNGLSTLVPLGRTCGAMRIRLAGGGDELPGTWSRDLSFSGWSLDLELSGQR